MVVVLIMGVMVGVVGSLMGGFITNFEMTDDQSIARRRASDVFNILHIPLLYAGMGVPADNFNYYFEPVNALGTFYGGAPISAWDGPVSVPSVPGGGNSIMRVVYGIPAGVKQTNADDVTEFSVNPGPMEFKTTRSIAPRPNGAPPA